MHTTASLVTVALTSLLVASPAFGQTAPPPAPPPACAPLATPLPPQPATTPPMAELRRSYGEMVTGKVIVGLAVVVTGGGVGVALAPDPCSGLLCGLDHIARGGALVLGGMLLGGVGAGLWAHGGVMPTSSLRTTAWMRPDVAVGPGSATLKWSF